MAKVRKAKYIYKDGVYYEVGGDGVDQTARDAAATAQTTAEAAQATADGKPSINDSTASATSVYSSSKLSGMIVRPNLLDNAYFVGGGSQGGYGKFPINQRGQTSYNAAGYGIDRWKLDGYVTLGLYPGYVGISKSNSAAYRGVSQRISISGMSGKTLILSVLYSGSTTGQCRFSVINSSNQLVSEVYPTVETINTITLSSVTFTSNDDILYIALRPHQLDLLRVVAVKLELGDTQTLAHQENGAWVLNEIPDYDSELSKCQRYLRIVDYGAGNYASVFGYGSGTTKINFFFPFPNMAGTPTISPNSGSNWTCRKYDGTAVTITSLEPWFASHSMVGIKVNGSGITQNALYSLSTNSATLVIFSCEP